MNDNSDLCLIVPCFFESKRIDSFLPHLCNRMQKLGGVRVLVVDDGSDETEQRQMNDFVNSCRHQYHCLDEIVLLPKNLGKGGAVYAGWGRRRSEAWLGFVDADGSCSAEETERMIKHAREISVTNIPSAFFASRVKMLGRDVERDFRRHILGRIYATLVSEILDIPVYDSQCGLKILPRNVFDEIENQLNTHGFAFDVELMVSLLDYGCNIKEFPIDWHEMSGGKVHLLRDSFRMFLDVLRIRQRRTLTK